MRSLNLAFLIICPPKNMTNAAFLPWSFGIWFHLEGLFLITGAVQRHSSINSLNDPAVPCCVIFSFGPLAMYRRGQGPASCCWFVPGRKALDHITTWVFSLKQEHPHRVYLHINICLQCMDRWLKTGWGSHAFFQSVLRLLMFTSNNS